MSTSIRYWLDGKMWEIWSPDPTKTLLEHLRGDLRRTGAKEGCAEGDCGACTVLVGELEGEGEEETVTWRAVNSCIQFLPMIDGKALITVESLAVWLLHPGLRHVALWPNHRREGDGRAGGGDTGGQPVPLHRLWPDH
jgi:xanthine dehydrogenase small subunit